MFIEPDCPVLYFSHLKSNISAGPGDPEQFNEDVGDHGYPDTEGRGHRDLFSDGDIVDRIKPAPEPVVLRILDNIEKRWRSDSQLD